LLIKNLILINFSNQISLFFASYRNVPLALLSGIGIVSAVYLAINVAYFAVLDVDTIKSSNAVAAVKNL
jgi:uncharacterized membrane protein